MLTEQEPVENAKLNNNIRRNIKKQNSNKNNIVCASGHIEMANTNMITGNHNSNSNSTAYTYNNYNSVSADSGNSSGSNGGGGSEVQTLREVCNMLNTGAPSSYMIPTGGCMYDHIITMMRGLNLQDDGIVLNNKIKAIEADFCNIVRDESMLWYVYLHSLVCMYLHRRPLMINT